MRNPHPYLTDFAHKIRIQRMWILAGSVTSILDFNNFSDFLTLPKLNFLCSIRCSVTLLVASDKCPVFTCNVGLLWHLVMSNRKCMHATLSTQVYIEAWFCLVWRDPNYWRYWIRSGPFVAGPFYHCLIFLHKSWKSDSLVQCSILPRDWCMHSFGEMMMYAV